MLTKFLILFCVSSIWTSSFKPVKDQISRIINGNQAILGQFPWQAALEIHGPFYGWFCGGTIISDECILTAGHCVSDGVSATVTVGSIIIPNTANLYSSAQLILHEGYSAKFLIDDIGLIRLSRKLTFNDNVQPIALASDDLGAGVDITVSGWGLTHDGGASGSTNLNYITIRTITNQECEQSYGQNHIFDCMVCAEYFGSTVQSPCSGDSGGPAVIDASSNPVHVAVVSFVSGDGCESGAPAGFTRTATYRDWIRSKSGV